MEEVKDVMVRNLPLDLLGPELENLFSEVGPIKKVAVIHHKKKPGDGGQVSRGFGFVKFSLADDALEAVKQYNGKNIRGRNISVELTSKDKKGSKNSTGAPATATKNSTNINAAVEQQRQLKAVEEQKKVNAGEVDSNKESSDEEAEKSATATTDVTSTNNAELFKKKKGGNLKASQQEIEENTQPANLRTVRIFGLSSETTDKKLMKRVRKLGVVEDIKLIQPEDAEIPVWPRGVMALVTMSTSKDAAKVINAFDQKMLHDKKLCVRYDVHVAKGERSVKLIGSSIAKTLRVIIRNLSFKATEEDVAAAFAALGPLSDVHIPYVEMPNPHLPGKMKKQSRGFGFIQFLLSNDLNKAMGFGGNPKKVVTICGREVTYEVAQAKKKFDELKSEEEASSATESKATGSDDPQMDSVLDAVDKDAQVEKEDGSDSSSDEDESSDSDASEQEEEEEQENEDDDSQEAAEEDSDSDDDSEGDTDEEDEQDGKGKTKKDTKGAAPEKDLKRVSKDVREGRTIFVKNLPFEAKNSDITHRFSEFGNVEKAMLVTDAGTGLSRGTAFVTFTTAESAKAAVAAASQYVKPADIANGLGGVMVLGRKIDAMIAVDRNSAKEFGKEGRDELKGKRDKRNLYLKDEGMVHGVGDALRQSEGKQRHKKKRHDADEKSCPASDMMKRTFAHADKKKKLNNPLFFISPLRLSVKNLSKKIDDSALKRIFAEAAQEGLRRKLVTISDVKAQIDAHADELHASKTLSANMKNEMKIPKLPQPDAPVRINACKIMRDLDKEGQPSRGYGFVEFQTHAHALAALRWTNNNPALSRECALGGSSVKLGSDNSEWPRLIVEFSVENKSKLQIIEKRRETSSKKAQQFKKIMENVEEKEGVTSEQKEKFEADVSSTKKEKVKKLSRGQRQREKKRQLLQNGGTEQESKGSGRGDEQQNIFNEDSAPTKQPLNDSLNRNNNKRARKTHDEDVGMKKKNGVVVGTQQRKRGSSGAQKQEEDAEIGALNVENSSEVTSGKKKKRKNNKNYEAKDDFTTMVNDYKAKLTGSGGGPSKQTEAASKTEGTEAKALAAKFQKSSARWFE